MVRSRRWDRAALRQVLDEAPSWLVSMVVPLVAFILLALLTTPRGQQSTASPALFAEMLDACGTAGEGGCSHRNSTWR
jgi:hypothetical protein